MKSQKNLFQCLKTETASHKDTHHSETLLLVRAKPCFKTCKHVSLGNLLSVCHLASLLVSLFVKMKAKVADSRQVVELEVLAPEHGVRAGLAGGARVQHVVQAKFAVVAFLGREFSGLDDPQLEHIVHPPTVVLRGTEVTLSIVITNHQSKEQSCEKVGADFWLKRRKNVIQLKRQNRVITYSTKSLTKDKVTYMWAILSDPINR